MRVHLPDIALNMPDQHHTLYFSLLIEYTDPDGLMAPLLPEITADLQKFTIALRGYLEHMQQEMDGYGDITQPLLADVEQRKEELEIVFEGFLTTEFNPRLPNGCQIDSVKVVKITRLPNDLHHAMAVKSDPAAWPTLQ